MDKIMEFIMLGVISLLVLFSLTPTIFSQYDVLDSQVNESTAETTTYFDQAPTGVEASVNAALLIFFVLALYVIYLAVKAEYGED